MIFGEWADFYLGRTPETDHRMLAIPTDAVILQRLKDEQDILPLSAKYPEQGKLNWFLRADGEHVWFGVNGFVEDILGKSYNGIDIYRPTNRPSPCVAGFVAKQHAGIQIPIPDENTLRPECLMHHGQYPFNHWSGLQQDRKLVTETLYQNKNFSFKGISSEVWKSKWQEAQELLKNPNSQFDLICNHGELPIIVEKTKQLETIENCPSISSVKNLVIVGAIVASISFAGWMCFQKKGKDGRQENKPLNESFSTRISKTSKNLDIGLP
jgi:hypothetical protein